jgi:hypothetical protein
MSMGQGRVRMVTHLDVSAAEIDRVCEIIPQLALS